MSLLLALTAGGGATSASIAQVDGADVQALSTTVTTGAAIAQVDGADVQALVGATWTTAQLTATDGADVHAVATSVTAGGTIAVTDGSDVSAITADIWTTAQIDTVDGSDVQEIIATVSSVTSASIDVVDGSDISEIIADVGTTERANRGGGWERFENLPKRKITKKIKKIVEHLLIDEQTEIQDLQIECSVNNIVYQPEYGEYLIAELKKAIKKKQDDEDEAISLLMLM